MVCVGGKDEGCVRAITEEASCDAPVNQRGRLGEAELQRASQTMSRRMPQRRGSNRRGPQMSRRLALIVSVDTRRACIREATERNVDA